MTGRPRTAKTHDHPYRAHERLDSLPVTPDQRRHHLAEASAQWFIAGILGEAAQGDPAAMLIDFTSRADLYDTYVASIEEHNENRQELRDEIAEMRETTIPLLREKLADIRTQADESRDNIRAHGLKGSHAKADRDAIRSATADAEKLAAKLANALGELADLEDEYGEMLTNGPTTASRGATAHQIYLAGPKVFTAVAQRCLAPAKIRGIRGWRRRAEHGAA